MVCVHMSSLDSWIVLIFYQLSRDLCVVGVLSRRYIHATSPNTEFTHAFVKIVQIKPGIVFHSKRKGYFLPKPVPWSQFNVSNQFDNIFIFMFVYFEHD